MAFGGIGRAIKRSFNKAMPQPTPQSMNPTDTSVRMGVAPLPNATKVMPKTLGFAKSALDTIKANASKYPEMVAPEGASYGSIRPMPTTGGFRRTNAPKMPMKNGGTTKLHSITKSNKKSNW